MLTEFEFLVALISAGWFGYYIFPGDTLADVAGSLLSGGLAFLGMAATIVWIKNSGRGNW
jgi:hypothetical protein